MPKDPHIMNLRDLQAGLAETVTRVASTKEPIFVALGGGRAVVIVDYEDYGELGRLADLGIFHEAIKEADKDEAEGALVPWEVINEEWKRKDEEWKKEHG